MTPDAPRRTPRRRRLLAGLLSAAAAAAAVALPLAPGAAAAAPAAEPTPPSARVIGGKPVPDGAYRFQAALLHNAYGDDDRERQFCGGSLISPYAVLTAAHCVEGIGDGPGDLPLRGMRVVVGRTVLSSTGGVKLTPVGVAMHPRYDPDTLDYDVAIVYLPRPVSVRPVLLATRGSDALQRPGRMVTVTGWGNTVQQPAEPVGPGSGLVRTPDRLRAAQVPVVADDECAASYTFAGSQTVVRGSRMICAGRTKLDTCQGDSGGPMFVATPAGYRQIGITSQGFGCGATGFPGVYTEISAPAISDWITGFPPPQP